MIFYEKLSLALIDHHWFIVYHLLRLAASCCKKKESFSSRRIVRWEKEKENRCMVLSESEKSHSQWIEFTAKESVVSTRLTISLLAFDDGQTSRRTMNSHGCRTSRIKMQTYSLAYIYIYTHTSFFPFFSLELMCELQGKKLYSCRSIWTTRVTSL